MTRNEKIVEFIQSAFELYDLKYEEYFSDVDDEGEYLIPMLVGGELDMSMVNRSAEILGATVEDLLSMNGQEVFKWLERFPYLELRKEFDIAYEDMFYQADHAEQRLIDAIWDTDTAKNYPRRYDYDDVVRRLVGMYKEYDKAVPGTYHKGAGIKHLYIQTQSFCSYKKFKTMMRSWFDMVERAETLFYKAVERELEPEEICEYNLLATQLGIWDRRSKKIREVNYRVLRALIPLFQEEGKQKFLECFMLDPNKMVKPWRCVEFLENREMVQAFVNIVPYAKSAMREHAMMADNFHCSFAWADAEPLEYSPLGEEGSVVEIGNMVRYLRLKDQFGGLTPCYAYVPKTPEELGCDGEYAKKLKALCAPAAKGGVSVPVGLGDRDDSDQLCSIRHIAAAVGDRHE